MEAMDNWDSEVYVDYYRLASGEIGRVMYDSMTGEYLGGEVVSKTGQWCKYPVNMILRDSMLITREEAEENAPGLCGQVQE